jgi:hypothetical protein
MSLKRRLLVLPVIIAITVSLTGCTPKLTAMPILLIPNADGWPVVEVPVCADDQITRAALYVPFGTGKIEHREAPAKSSQARVVHFALNDSGIKAGSITGDIQVTEFVPYVKLPSKPSELGEFVVQTTRYRAMVKFNSTWLDSPGPSLVFGMEGSDDNAYHKSVTAAAGQEVIQRWCQDKR